MSDILHAFAISGGILLLVVILTLIVSIVTVNRGAADRKAKVEHALRQKAVDDEDRTEQTEPGTECIGPMLNVEQRGGAVAAERADEVCERPGKVENRREGDAGDNPGNARAIEGGRTGGDVSQTAEHDGEQQHVGEAHEERGGSRETVLLQDDPDDWVDPSDKDDQR